MNNPQMSKHGEVVMPGDIDLSPRSETSRIQSGNNNLKPLKNYDSVNFPSSIN
jgi:hypothetical protein